MGAVYTQLSLRERCRIEDWWHAKVPVREMARVLKRSKSTIHREIKRNFWAYDAFPKKYEGYFGHAAQLQMDERRSVQRKLIRHPDPCKTAIAQIKQSVTPEQIGNRMMCEGAKLRVCHEIICRYISSKEGMDQEPWWHLPEHRKARGPRRARKRRQKPKFDRDVSILFRRDDVAHSCQFGHWEADLVLFKQHFSQSNVTSLGERVSRFTVLMKNPNKRTKPVMGKIMKAVRDLPHFRS
ncbi:MAG: IS30 family transposase [Pseudomonadota bacterium]